jgi:hypothetical protein
VPWQDWVFSAGGFLILLSLIPTLRGDQKPALTTSVMSAAVVASFAVTMATLELWLSALANGGISLAWGVLAMQRYTVTKRERHAGILAQIETEVVDVAISREEYDPGQPEKGSQPA